MADEFKRAAGNAVDPSKGGKIARTEPGFFDDLNKKFAGLRVNEMFFEPTVYNGLGNNERYEALKKAALSDNFTGDKYFTQEQIKHFKEKAPGLGADKFLDEVRAAVYARPDTPYAGALNTDGTMRKETPKVDPLGDFMKKQGIVKPD